MTEPLVEAEGLVKRYRSARLFRRPDLVTAVDGVSLAVAPREVVGLVGESGSGKSTVGRLLMGLESPDAGSVRFQGAPVSARNDAAARAIRRDMQIIFQDPRASLNPHMRIGAIVGEPLVIHRQAGSRAQLRDKAAAMLEIVGLDASFLDRLPHALSGGQQQRVAIARALILNPRFVVADEPITSLDVSIRAQIINLLQDLQERFALSMLFISHDLSVVRHLCRRIVVLYKGRVVEEADAARLFEAPAHPYTQALLSAIPVPDPDIERQRRPLHFDPAAHPGLAEAELVEIAPGHRVAR